MTNMQFAKITINSKEIELPIISSTIGPYAVDVSSFYKNTGYFTYDPGFMSTASCKSSITYIDGEQGILQYRGYDIRDIAEQRDFIDTIYLLIFGSFPNEEEKGTFSKHLKQEYYLEKEIETIIKNFPSTSHPMAILMAALSSLAALYHEDNNILPNEKDLLNYKGYDKFIYKMIAKIPTMIAYIYHHTQNQEFIPPNEELSYSENFLYMMFGKTASPELVKAMDVIFILHADHEQNASTSTVRLSASSGTNLFSAITAGIATLWGPSHGGANEAVIKMLEEISTADKVPSYIQKIKNKTFRLMGFGHRVYKNYDPRASVLKQHAEKVLQTLNNENETNNNQKLSIAKALEKHALNDDYFIERKLYPNVDFYSGVILEAMKIPTNMFTTIFALSRTTGWVAQLIEIREDSEQKIGRPRQIYTGKVE